MRAMSATASRRHPRRPLRQRVPAQRRARRPAAGGRHARRRRHAAARRGARPRRHPVAQPGDVRDDVDGARGAARDRREPAPQLHRPRRVPADGGDRAALHPHARRPLPRAGRDDRHAHAGLVGGDHARRAVAEVEVARAARGRRQGDRPAEPRLRRRRARRVGEVLPLLRRRAADHPAAAAQVHDRARGRRAARRREHDRRRRRARHDVHRPRRRHRRHQRPARAPARGRRARRAAAHRRRQRRLRVAVPVPRLAVGLPPRAGALDQRVRPQVRARLPGARLARLPRAQRPARGPRLLRELPRQARRDVHAELLDRRRHGPRAVLQLHPLRARGLPLHHGDDAVQRPRAGREGRRGPRLRARRRPRRRAAPARRLQARRGAQLRRVRRRLAARRRARLDGARLHAAPERPARDDHARAGQADARPRARLDAGRRHRAGRRRRSARRAGSTSSTASA